MDQLKPLSELCCYFRIATHYWTRSVDSNLKWKRRNLFKRKANKQTTRTTNIFNEQITSYKVSAIVATWHKFLYCKRKVWGEWQKDGKTEKEWSCSLTCSKSKTVEKCHSAKFWVWAHKFKKSEKYIYICKYFGDVGWNPPSYWLYSSQLSHCCKQLGCKFALAIIISLMVSCLWFLYRDVFLIHTHILYRMQDMKSYVWSTEDLLCTDRAEASLWIQSIIHMFKNQPCSLMTQICGCWIIHIYLNALHNIQIHLPKKSYLNICL